MKKRILACTLAAMLVSFVGCGGSSSVAESSGAEATSAASSDVETSAVETTSAADSTANSGAATTGAADSEADSSSDTTAAESTSESDSNVLVAVFSLAGEQYNVGVIEEGNTAIIADMIVEQTGADLFRIENVTPYPETYDELLNVSREEEAAATRPQIAGTVENMEDYDVVFLGYPIWWGDMPMIVYGFLESYDFSGKTIVPFCTHGGSGLANTPQSIADTCPNATVAEGLAISGTTAQNERDTALTSVTEWLTAGGYITGG